MARPSARKFGRNLQDAPVRAELSPAEISRRVEAAQSARQPEIGPAAAPLPDSAVLEVATAAASQTVFSPAALAAAEAFDVWVPHPSGLRRWRPSIDVIDVQPFPGGKVLIAGGLRIPLPDAEAAHVGRLLIGSS